jgi:high-affinity iron transporter
MIGQFLITFREAFEAALIVSIILVYLGRTGKENFRRYIWTGTIVAIVLSIIIGAFVWVLYRGFSDSAVKLFEGIAALIAVAVLTSMILWMALRSATIKEELKAKVENAAEKGTALGFVGLAFVVVFREGFETVLFLTPFSVSDLSGTILGLLLGLASGIILSSVIFIFGVKIELKRFFYFTSILLILLAAGLLGYGVHELMEYNEAVGNDGTLFSATAFDLGISSDSIFHHKGAVGSIFAVMFGYSVKMEWGRVVAHAAYLAFFMPVTLLIYLNPDHIVIEKLRKIGGFISGGKKERFVAKTEKGHHMPRHESG